MKIEKISDSQIRCTLSKKDLVDRELRLSELAYGTEKAKALFRDMMQQASYELGFEADDIPLMIEAIPVSSECLVLVVTKVDNPDELDTRFSRFTDNYSDELEDDIADEDYEDDDYPYDDASLSLDVIEDYSTNNDVDMFSSLPKSIDANELDYLKRLNDSSMEKSNKECVGDICRIFTFDNLEDVIRSSYIITPYFDGDSCLLKNPVTSQFYLLITRFNQSTTNFNRVCGIISEYGRLEKTTYASQYYYSEHFDVIIPENAIGVLSTL